MGTRAHTVVPVTLLTGYLGSGKTTLLNRILAEPHGEKIAVIVNEFGEVGIDQRLIVRGDDEIIEMANGCVCCVVKDDTVISLYSMNERRAGRATPKLEYDRVIIEASGIANPVPLMRMILEDERLVDGYSLAGVVALIDAEHFKIQVTRSIEVKEQIACADVLLINKIDRIDELELLTVVERISGINPHAQSLMCINAKVDIKTLLNSQRENTFAISEYYCERMHDEDVQSVVLRASKSLSKFSFDKWLGEHIVLRADDLYRYKGIIAIDGKNARTVVQGVHAYFDMRDGDQWLPDEDRESILVVIGRDLNSELLRESFKNCQIY
ncbi:MAG: GTP-binding protein [bacterium]|nr:GTP-binding protein [bacterium]